MSHLLYLVTETCACLGFVMITKSFNMGCGMILNWKTSIHLPIVGAFDLFFLQRK
jgi:hypothetical protein